MDTPSVIIYSFMSDVLDLFL